MKITVEVDSWDVEDLSQKVDGLSAESKHDLGELILMMSSVIQKIMAEKPPAKKTKAKK